MKTLRKILRNILQFFWSPFNRDALWCVCINETYCTWNPKKLTKNLTFCHVDDETQQRRERVGVALRIVNKPTPRSAILEIPYLVGLDSDSSLQRIHVETLEDITEKVDGWFRTFGWYHFDGTKTVDGRNYLSLTQINRNDWHVFKEPFIDFGQCDR
jgi:hypothetical protein